ncbi:MAG: DUF58 domain-containing protein [Phycisphaerales bacterium]
MTAAELARQVRLLEISTRHIVTEVFAGDYSSAFKGRGIEFSDVREYQPGDDVRSIDWNVTARTGRPFIKRFTEERELTVVLAVDLSGSGGFGTTRRTKRELACEVAALLAFAAVRKGDRVGLVIFTDQVERYVPPKKGTRHTLRLVRELLAFEPGRAGTSMRAVSDHLGRVLHRRSLVFLISDYLCGDFVEAVRRLAPRHDLVAVDVADPRDFELAPAGLMDVRDPETGRTMVIDTSSRRVREAYRQAALDGAASRAAALRRQGVDRLGLSTDSEHVHELIEFFRKREQRKGR